MIKGNKPVDPEKWYPYQREAIDIRESCVKNHMNGMLDRLDYNIFGSEKFEDQPYVKTQRMIEIKNIYNSVLIQYQKAKNANKKKSKLS